MVKNNYLNSRGFTIIELLVVMSILSFLASIIFANINIAREKATNVAVNATMRNIMIAFKAYRLDHGYYPPTNSLDEAILARPVSGTCTGNTWYGSSPPYLTVVPSVENFLVEYMGQIPTIPVVSNGGVSIECPIYHCFGDPTPEDGCHGIALLGYSLQGTNSTCLPGIYYPAGNDYTYNRIHICGDYRP